MTPIADKRMRHTGVSAPLSGRDARMEVVLFVLAPTVLTVCLLVFLLAHQQFAFDFRREYWVAGWRLLHGGSPYHWTLAQIHQDTAFAYPAAAAALMTPLALLPLWVGSVLMSAACMASVSGTLRVLGVTDWRLYGLTMMWAPVAAGWASSNLTLPLVFMLALVWRYRDRPVVAGLLTGLMFSLKPFLWPIAVWLLTTRRYRAAAWCCGGAVAVNALAWSFLGLPEIGDYLTLATRVTDALYQGSYGVMALAAHLGASKLAGEVLLLMCSLLLGALCIRAGSDRALATLAICVVLALVASPLVDTHYFAFLIVPLAIARPRLGWQWVAPLALWLCPESTTSGWEAILAWLVVAAVVYPLLSRTDRTSTTPASAFTWSSLGPRS